jgi:arylsulfatase A-like enzyme
MWPQISNPAAKPIARLLYWTTPTEASVRDGDWKLIVPRAEGGRKGKAKKEGTGAAGQLFDLAKDPYETTNLAAKMPEKVAELKQKLATMAKADNDALAND